MRGDNEEDGADERPGWVRNLSLTRIGLIVGIVSGLITIAAVFGLGGDDSDAPPGDASAEFCGDSVPDEEISEMPAANPASSQLEYVFAIEATNAECDLAMTVIKEWILGPCDSSEGICTVASGYDCENKRIASEVTEVRCSEGSRIVEFSFGV